jgi:hypothetical protein
MIFGVFAMRVLQVMFFMGMAGSVFIVSLTCIRVLISSLSKKASEVPVSPSPSL